MTKLEIEIKADLQNEENYRKLLGFLSGKSGEIKQDNYFFDTNDWKLSQSGWALRIRLEDDSAELTVKGPAEADRIGVVIRPELTQFITLAQALRFVREGLRPSEIDPELSGVIGKYIADDKLNCCAHFINYRIDAPYRDIEPTLKFEIDRTVYPDGSVDFELEIEFKDPGQFEMAAEGIAGLFRTLSIPLIFQKKSKYARALDRLTGKKFV